MSSNGYQYDYSHAFRLYFDPNPDAGLFDWMDQWLTNWEPWEDPDYGPNDLPVLRNPPESDADSYYSATWWFSFNQNAESIYAHLIGSGGQITELTARTDWARVGHHKCTHPGAGGPCAWDEVRDHGTVPVYIEDMG